MKKLKALKKWWEKNYFHLALMLYLLFFMQRAYGGAYDTRHEFTNGFTTELFGYISMIPATVGMGIFMAIVAVVYIMEKKDVMTRYLRALKLLMVATVFYFLLRSGIFEPIRILTETMLNTKFLDVRLVDVAQPFISVADGAEFSFELIFGAFFVLVVNVIRYFLYLNVSMLYLLGSIGAATFIGLETMSFMRRRFRESEEEAVENALFSRELSLSNIVPFRKKSEA